MPWNNGLTQLQYELSDLYFQEDNIRRVAVQAGIPAAVLDIDAAALTAWYNVLREAVNREKVTAIVDIAKEEFPVRQTVLTRALAQHESGVGAWEAALAEFNRLLATYFKEVIAGVIVAVVTTWVMTGIGEFFLQREFMILLLFLIILLTPFLLRAGLTRLRIPIRRVTILLLSILLMAGEAALFAEVVGGREPQLVQGISVDASYFTTPAGRYLKGKAGCIELSKEYCTNQVKVKGEAGDAQLRVRRSDWKAPTLYLFLNLEWTAREAMPGFRRYFEGTMLFKTQYRCEGGKPLLKNLEIVQSTFAPSRGVLAWLIGFIQIPYLRDGDSTILSEVEQTLIHQIPLCSEPL